MNQTGIVRDDRYMDHEMGSYHPESPRRLQAIYDMLDSPEMAGLFSKVNVRRSERDELLAIHSSEYIDMLASTEGSDSTYLDPDTQTSPGSYAAALLAAGGLCEAVKLVNSRAIDNAFALVRPPGHHAERSRAMGFCLFNNIAVATRYAQTRLGVERVLIADWDLHHGNGTQHSFEDDPSILYFSTHQYPGTGACNDVGVGKGKGFTINVPLSAGYGDGEYAAIYESILPLVAAEFKPELILVSAGFDIYRHDPLGGMDVTQKGFAALTRILMDIAEATCEGRLVMTLEGGYHIEGERDSVKSVLRELAGLESTDIKDLISKADKRMVDRAIAPVKEAHRNYWKDI